MTFIQPLKMTRRNSHAQLCGSAFLSRLLTSQELLNIILAKLKEVNMLHTPPLSFKCTGCNDSTVVHG